MKITLRILWHRLTFRWPRRLLELLGRREYRASYHWWSNGIQFHAYDGFHAWSYSHAVRIARRRCPASSDWRRATWDLVRADQLVG